MIANDIETYRGFVIRMRLEHAGALLACTISFARRDGREFSPVPPEFTCRADKENASALTFTVAMQTRARAFIDRWLEPQSDQSSDKCLSDDVSHPVEKTRLRSRRSC
jgi:hypothetical protein